MEVIEKESTTETVDTPVVSPEEEQASAAPEEEQASAAPEGEANRPLLVDIPVDSESTALNLLVGFLNVAQRRGTFNFKESAKIGQCIEMFVKGPSGQ